MLDRLLSCLKGPRSPHTAFVAAPTTPIARGPSRFGRLAKKIPSAGQTFEKEWPESTARTWRPSSIASVTYLIRSLQLMG